MLPIALKVRFLNAFLADDFFFKLDQTWTKKNYEIWTLHFDIKSTLYSIREGAKYGYKNGIRKSSSKRIFIENLIYK